MDFHRHNLGFWEPAASGDHVHSYPAGGNASCYAIEARSHWFAARNRMLEWAIEHFRFSGAFLDIGGGNGYQLHHFQEGVFRRLNILSAMCEPGADGCVNATERGVQNVYHCDFRGFPLAQYEIGGIGLFDVLEHIEADSKFLRGIMDACPRGTRFYITVPAIRPFWSSADTYAGHFRRYDRREFDRIVNETGLRPVYRTYFFSYYAPFVWLLRVLPEKFRGPYSTEEIARREAKFHGDGSRLKNGILSFLHAVETLFIRTSVPVPFGTSMLMILDKA